MGRKHKFDYFGAFEQHSKLAVAESALLVETIEQFTEASALEKNTQKAHEIEHEGDTINHKIFKTVATDFITPIDREDIIEMCQALDDIVDDIEDVMLRQGHVRLPQLQEVEELRAPHREGPRP